MLAFYYDYSASNPAEVFTFSVKEAGVGPLIF